MTKVVYSTDHKGIINDPFFQEFNLLFKNAFNTDSNFRPFGKDVKVNYPLDAWYNDEFYVFDIPLINANINDVELTVESDILRIKYTRSDKEESNPNVTYVTKGIVRRDFDFVWKIPSKFDKDKISSTFENGLLSVYIPFAEQAKPTKIAITDVSGNWKKVAEKQPLTD